MKQKLFLFLFFPVIIFSETLSLHVKPFFYADNTEFFNSYRVGETYLGNDWAVYSSYVPSRFLQLRFGLYLNLYYGDEQPVSQILPVSSFEYHVQNHFVFIMGTLHSADRHNMLDAFQSEELSYYKAMEYGFQMRLHYSLFDSDSWINWKLLNTAAHREYFDFGNNFVWHYKIFRLNLQTYISHHGGQLYHTGAVKDNLSLALGTGIDYRLPNFLFNGFGGSVYYLTDKNVVDRTLPDLTTTGFGFLSEIYVLLYKFKIYCNYWKGHNFITEEGNPMYQIDDHYFFYGFKKEKNIDGNTKFEIELRMHSFEKKWEYQYRFGFKSNFEFKLHTS